MDVTLQPALSNCVASVYFIYPAFRTEKHFTTFPTLRVKCQPVEEFWQANPY